MTVACLVDTTRCIGCRSCQVACKQAHGLKADDTKFFAAEGGYQNPLGFTPYTRTYVAFHERDPAGGGPAWVFVKHQCMHCKDMRCANVCAPQIYWRTPEGVVAFAPSGCIGCSACVDECPFGVPVIDYWDVDTPHLRKCTFCLDRQEAEIESVRLDDRPLSGREQQRYEAALTTPACVRACPTGALCFGARDELLAEARRRIAAAPDRYVDHIYGEKELGGLGWLYLAAVPFKELGFPTEFPPPMEHGQMGMHRPQHRPRPGRCRVWSSLSGALGATLAGLTWFFRRREKVRRSRS